MFVREDGGTIQLTREEWDKRFPGREPVVLLEQESEDVFDANITHNLGKMAEAAGIYRCLWHPEELGIAIGRELIEPLTTGLELLESDPERFKAHNSLNGWGMFVPWVRVYRDACEEYPDATVRVSR